MITASVIGRNQNPIKRNVSHPTRTEFASRGHMTWKLLKKLQLISISIFLLPSFSDVVCETAAALDTVQHHGDIV